MRYILAVAAVFLAGAAAAQQLTPAQQAALDRRYRLSTSNIPPESIIGTALTQNVYFDGVVTGRWDSLDYNVGGVRFNSTSNKLERLSITGGWITVRSGSTFVASGVTNDAPDVLVLQGSSVGAHSNVLGTSYISIRENPTNVVTEQVDIQTLRWDGTPYASPSTLLSGYFNSVSVVGTDPGDPHGTIQLYDGGSTVGIYGYAKGQGGITITNGPDGTLYVSGDPTNSVDALFPVQTSAVARLYYRPPVVPYNMTYAQYPAYTNGYLFFNGTNFYPVAQIVPGDATNALLLNNHPSAYYRNMINVTNFSVFDDATYVGTDVNALDVGSNAVASIVTRTNPLTGVTYRALKLDSGSGGSNYLLYADNVWSGVNTFSKPVSALLLYVTGDGNSRGGSYSTVSGGTNNSAAGAYATVAGGGSASAAGTYAAVGGGFDTVASGFASAVPGGYDATAAGAYSLAFGYDVQVSGIRSMVFGEYARNTRTDVAFFGWGSSATNTDSATLTTNGLEVAGKIKAWAGFEGDGSGLTGITAVASTTNAVKSVAYSEGTSNHFYVVGDTQLVAIIKTNYAGAITVSGTGGTGVFTTLVFPAGGGVTNVVIAGSTASVYVALSKWDQISARRNEVFDWTQAGFNAARCDEAQAGGVFSRIVGELMR